MSLRIAFIRLASHAGPPFLAMLLLGAPTMAGAQVREIALPANDLIFDAARQRILASVPSRAGGTLGNTITVINPSTGQIGPSVFVGSEPGKMALADDGRSLYVALNGAAAVRRVDAATLTPGLQFGLGSDPYFGPYYVEDLEVLPGTPNSIAVSRKRLSVSPGHGGVAIYDNGVMRPTTTPDHTGSNVIEFGATAGRLYGLNTESTEFGFRRMDVTVEGVTVVDVTPGIVSVFNEDMEMDGGRVYLSSGSIIDAELRQLVGTFTLPSPLNQPAVRPAADAGRVYFVTEDFSSSELSLRTFDAQTFVPLGTVGIAGASGSPGSLIRVGPTGLAFRTDTDQVFLLGITPSSTTASLTLALTGCAAACRGGESFAVAATVSNPGPQAIRVEVKAGVVMPDGSTMNIWSGGHPHYEATLPPGLTTTVELLRATLPGGLQPGTWTYEAALLSVDLGRTVARDSRTFTLTP